MITSTLSYSQTNMFYADQGTGKLRNIISWFNWEGLIIKNGATRNFITPDGLNVNITINNITNPPIPYTMNTWSGAVLWNQYNYSNSIYKSALYNNGNSINSEFTININASRNGLPVKFIFVAADAEASSIEETKIQTTGTTWKTIDFFKNSTQNIDPVYGCNTQNIILTNTYGGSANIGQSPVVCTESNTNGTLTISTILDKKGIIGGMAVAFGILSPIDRGDLPSSYGYAQHQIKYDFYNSCAYSSNLEYIYPINNLFLGNTPPDLDAFQSLDDNTIGVDEDAFANVFPSYNSNGIYSLSIPISNTTGNNAYISGWFDYNRNGIFDSNENVTGIAPNNSTSVLLTWYNLPTVLPQTNPNINDFAFRFRISSVEYEANSPIGYASDGEVEDYLIPITTSCPQDCYWTINGNSINSNQFIGTLNNQNLIFKTNSIERMILTGSTGFVGIGLSNGVIPNAKLHIDNGNLPNIRFQNLPNTRVPEYVYIDNSGFLYRSKRTFLGLEYDDVDSEISNAILNLTERLNKLEEVLLKCECGKEIFQNNKTPQKKVITSSIISIAPNPSNGFTKISYLLSDEEDINTVELRLMNEVGIVLKSHILRTTKGHNTWTLADSSLPSANYIIALIINNRVVDSKILIISK